jgi:hypothetical protein
MNMTGVDDLAQWAPYVLGAFLLISALRAFKTAATGIPPPSWNQEGASLSRSRRIAGLLFGLLALAGAVFLLTMPEWILQRLGR